MWLVDYMCYLCVCYNVAKITCLTFFIHWQFLHFQHNIKRDWNEVKANSQNFPNYSNELQSFLQWQKKKLPVRNTVGYFQTLRNPWKCLMLFTGYTWKKKVWYSIIIAQFINAIRSIVFYHGTRKQGMFVVMSCKEVC